MTSYIRTAVDRAETQRMADIAREEAIKTRALVAGDPPFTRGQVVTLKSGGMRMTVASAWYNHSCSAEESGWEVETMHARYDGHDIIEHELPAEMLMIAPPETADLDIPF